MVNQAGEIDRLNRVARQSFGPQVRVANPRLFSDFITQAAAAFEEERASLGQVAGAGPRTTPVAQPGQLGIETPLITTPVARPEPIPQGMGLLATPSPMDLERRRLITQKYLESGLTPPTWASTEELEDFYALRTAPTPPPVEGQVAIPSVEEQQGKPFTYRLGRLGEFAQRLGADTFAAYAAATGQGFWAGAPPEFLQAVEEERALGPRLGEIDPQTPEARALQRTSPEFFQMPIIPGIPFLQEPGEALWTLGGAEAGAEAFNPLNIPPLGATKAAVRGAGAVGAAAKAITREATQGAVGAAGRRAGAAVRGSVERLRAEISPGAVTLPDRPLLPTPRQPSRTGRVVNLDSLAEGEVDTVLTTPGTRVSYETWSGRRITRVVGDDLSLQKEPWRGPQPGLTNIKRMARGENIARGRAALIDRLQLEGNLGTPGIAGETDYGEAFIRALPDELLEDVGLSIRSEPTAGDLAFLRGEVVGSRGLLGTYDPALGLATLYRKVIANSAFWPDEVLIHELSHSLQRYVPPEDLALLRRQYQREVAAAASRRVSRGATVGVKPELGHRLSAFEEWFAEAITSRGMRDVAERTVPQGGVFTRTARRIREIAVGFYNWLRTIGRGDHAERVYRNLVLGRERQQLSPAISERLGFAAGPEPGAGAARGAGLPEGAAGLPGGGDPILPDDIIQSIARVRQAADEGAETVRREGIKIEELPEDEIRAEIIGEALGDEIADLTKEMRRRGVNLTPEIVAESRASLNAIARIGNPARTLGAADRENSLLWDVIAERHGGKSVTSPFEIVGDQSVGGRLGDRLLVDTENPQIAAEVAADIDQIAAETRRALFGIEAEARIGPVPRALPEAQQAATTAPTQPPAAAAARGAGEVVPAVRAQQLLDTIKNTPEATFEEAVDIAAKDLFEVHGEGNFWTVAWQAKGPFKDIELGWRYLGSTSTRGIPSKAKAENFAREFGIKNTLKNKSFAVGAKDLTADPGNQMSLVREALIRTGKFDISPARQATRAADVAPTAPIRPPTGAAAAREAVGGIPERPRVATAFDTGIAAPEQIDVLKAANNPPPPVREAEGLVTGRWFSEADIDALVAVRNNLPVSAETQGVLATEKLTRLLRQAEVATEETIRLRAEELRGITARAAGAAEAVSPRGAGPAARGQLGGERALGQFEPLRPQFTDDDLDSLFGRIWGTDDRFFTKLNADTALTNLLQGHIPTPSELRLLRERFGPELVRAARDLRPLSQRVRENVIEVLNIPQVLRSSFDFSAPLRQGILLSAGHPREFVKSFVPMFRAAFDPAEFRRINADIVAHPDFDRLVNEGGLFLHDVEGTIGLALREEAFMGRILQRIPVLGAGIKASERGFATYLNKLRFDVATNTLDNWRSAGIKVTPDRVRRMNRWLNVATGRGRLGKFESIGPELNAAFWSPRLVMSRIQAPLSIFERDPVIRKMVVGDLLKFFGAGMAILGLIKASNAAEVELNPRSSDFGKVRVGPSRVEFWGGMQPIARYLAQAVSGSRKTVTGKAAGATVPQPPSDTIIRFLRSKLAPGLPSIVANRVFQETFIGEDLDEASGLLTEEYGVEVTAEQRELFGQLVPLIIVDILEGVEEQGLLGGAIGATALFGTGTTAFGGPTGTQGRGGPVAKGRRSAADPRHFARFE